ncbi:MAG: OmpH family outer membrane protein [Gammaproteobacteria bacterium]|nr:OmpH family outer membrane protein [Gammaproteobacteria bacterium]NNC97838.1 OmpH family outer membrane protein [Gammaproteobacteria bacterium]NNM13711.1 OmpH family outer membrane protein [Gammaproteobacteria bacterium]
MKKLVIFALLSIMLGTSIAVQAEVKIAVVNFPRLLAEAPQVKTATAAIQKEYESKAAQLKAKQKEVEQELIALKQQVERDFDVMSDDQKRAKSEEFRNKQIEFNAKEKQLLQEFNLKRNEKLGELNKTLMTQVNGLAQEQGYDLVLSEGVIYAKAALDITDKVLARLR